jgi:hypothetical protein
MGGYGQYYAGSLYGLGLTHRAEDGIYRTATGRREALARAFDDSVAHTQILEAEPVPGEGNSAGRAEKLRRTVSPLIR